MCPLTTTTTTTTTTTIFTPNYTVACWDNQGAAAGVAGFYSSANCANSLSPHFSQAQWINGRKWIDSQTHTHTHTNAHFKAHLRPRFLLWHVDRNWTDRGGQPSTNRARPLVIGAKWWWWFSTYVAAASACSSRKNNQEKVLSFPCCSTVCLLTHPKEKEKREKIKYMIENWSSPIFS